MPPLDVWDIPSESATRVGHPGTVPGRTATARSSSSTRIAATWSWTRSCGSGSTAVAAVRTERHYIGFDTDEEYVALAERRIAEERKAMIRSASAGAARRRVTVSPGRSSSADGTAAEEDQAVMLGRKASELAHQALETCGFQDIERNVTYRDLGLTVDFRARDAGGGLWLFELSRGLFDDPARSAASRCVVAGAGQGLCPPRGPVAGIGAGRSRPADPTFDRLSGGTG